jgi:preprotein translocase subunit SecB
LVIVNGAAILFGLLRGQVAQVTAMSHYGTFLLPPVNLVEAFNDKAKANMELVDSGDEG